MQPAKNGITTKEVFNSLDLKQHVFFFDRVEYLKELSDITPLRHELGLRTVFNTIEKLLNPGESEYGVTTAFHKPYVKKYLAMFKEYYKEVLVVKASEGSPEVFKDGKYWIKEDKEQIIIDSKFKLNFIAGCISFDSKVSFINCIFEGTAMFHGAIFEKKAIFKNCKFNSISEFSSTYFLDRTFFENCYFSNFLSFSGSQFDKEFIFKNNYLKKGSDLLGNLDKPYKVLFKKETFIEGNIGNLELNT